MIFKNTSFKFPITNDSEQEIVLVIEPWAHVYRLQPKQSFELKTTCVKDISASLHEVFHLEFRPRVIIIYEGEELLFEIFRDNIKIEPFADGFPEDFKEIYGE